MDPHPKMDHTSMLECLKTTSQTKKIVEHFNKSRTEVNRLLYGMQRLGMISRVVDDEGHIHWQLLNAELPINVQTKPVSTHANKIITHFPIPFDNTLGNGPIFSTHLQKPIERSRSDDSLQWRRPEEDQEEKVSKQELSCTTQQYPQKVELKVKTPQTKTYQLSGELYTYLQAGTIAMTFRSASPPNFSSKAFLEKIMNFVSSGDISDHNVTKTKKGAFILNWNGMSIQFKHVVYFQVHPNA